MVEVVARSASLPYIGWQCWATDGIAHPYWTLFVLPCIMGGLALKTGPAMFLAASAGGVVVIATKLSDSLTQARYGSLVFACALFLTVAYFCTTIGASMRKLQRDAEDSQELLEDRVEALSHQLGKAAGGDLTTTASIDDGGDPELLPAAVDEGDEGGPPPDQQRAAADGTAELVRGQREQVRPGGGEVDGEGTDGLDGVGVHRHARGVGEVGGPREGLEGPDLVVGPHQRDQGDVVGPLQGLREGVEVHAAARVDRQPGHLGPLVVAQPLHAVQDGVVLGGREQDAPARGVGGAAGPQQALEGEVVALGAPGGPDDLARARAERRRQGLAALLDGGPGPAAGGVQRGGVAGAAGGLGDERLQRLRTQGRRRGVVQVRAHTGQSMDWQTAAVPVPIHREPPAHLRSGAHPLGVTLRGDGADVAVLASHADAVEVCVFDEDGSEVRTRLPDVELGVWHGHVPGLVAGSRYGLRVHGRWDPERGLRHNPAKLLLDPYARGVEGEVALAPEIFGHTVGEDLRGDLAVADPRDSAPHVPRGVVLAPMPAELRVGEDERPRTPWADTVLYEAHVRGLTRRFPGVPEEERGTYAALAHPAVLQHLGDLGVTALELLPVHASTSEIALRRRGLSNYWGYNTLAFNAPHPGYATAAARAAGPEGVRAEFRRAVAALHGAGIEVVLDVVYNHTCEEGPDGPHLSLRGLDDATYYLRDAGGRPFDVTGCGNSLDFADRRVVQFALDSLRHWVSEYGVDGFRFDLMTTLARGRDGYSPDHPFLVALGAGPGAGRDEAHRRTLGRRALRLADGAVPRPGPRVERPVPRRRPPVLALRRPRDRPRAPRPRRPRARPAGAGDAVRRVGRHLRRAARGRLTSVNFVTAHDGFTLADLTAYDHKHNEANGEGNRDGSDSDSSWNHGVEGASTDADVLELRRRSMRNLFATLVLSSGVPMITAGDEFGRSQGGNNNAYCQDNEVGWIDWDLADWQRELLTDVQDLLALRRRYPVLREAGVRRGSPVREQRNDLLWFSEDGEPMSVERWHEADRRILQVLVDGRDRGEASVLVVLNGGPRQRDIVLPTVAGAGELPAPLGQHPRPAAPAQRGRALAAGGPVVGARPRHRLTRRPVVPAPLVLLPGTGCGSEQFRFLAAAFADGFDVPALELPGHRGAPPVAGTASLDAVAEHLAARVPPGSVLLGHSTGGVVALLIAVRHPDRVVPAGPAGRQRARDPAGPGAQGGTGRGGRPDRGGGRSWRRRCGPPGGRGNRRCARRSWRGSSRRPRRRCDRCGTTCWPWTRDRCWPRWACPRSTCGPAGTSTRRPWRR